MTLSAWPLGTTALLALVTIGCSDPVPPAPRGNLVFNLSVCDNLNGAVGPDRSADVTTRRTQLPDMNGTQPGRRVEDGQEGASVRCTVDGGSTNQVSASISGIQAHPSETIVQTIGMTLTDGWIQKDSAGGGAGEAFISLLTGGITYDSVGPCTLSLNSPRTGNQFTVDAGRVYARFDCANLTDPPTSGCRASGAFVFERCQED